MKCMHYEIDSFGMSDIGNVRSNNEDLFEIVIDKHFFVLADGMGGHNAGEVAASEAIKSITRSVRYAPAFSTPEEVSKYLLNAVEKANNRVWQLSLEDDAFTGMGTTLSCCMIHENHLIYAHVGDSRLYRYRNGLQQLSRDHSLRAMLLEEQDIDPALLDQPGFKNVITRALGTQAHVMADIGVIPIHSNDLFMLCSDGLTDLVPDSQIATIFSSGQSLKETCQTLISAALEKGGNDNITVLLVKTIISA